MQTIGGVDAIYLSFDYICFSDYYDKQFKNLDSSISSKHAMCMSRSRPRVPSMPTSGPFNGLQEKTQFPLGRICVFTGACDRWWQVIFLDNGVLHGHNGNFNEGKTTSHKEVQPKPSPLVTLTTFVNFQILSTIVGWWSKSFVTADSGWRADNE